MLKLGRKVEYALMALLHVSQQPPEQPTSRREIAESYSIPNELLGKVMQALKHAGLVDSIQGTRGGYILKRPLDQIALGDVIQAIEGPLHSSDCSCLGLACDREQVCNIRFMMNRFYADLQTFVFGMSLHTFQTGFNPRTTTLTVNAKVTT